MTTPLLSVENLSVEFSTNEGVIRAVDDVSFSINAGETLAIVGESGCGKSTTALAILGLLPAKFATVTSGLIAYQGRDLVSMQSENLRKVRGNDIAMVFQDPMTSLDPLMTVGRQIGEAVKTHCRSLTGAEARARVLDVLRMVGMPDPDLRIDQYPHQFSGGMRQRAMVAMALVNKPKLLIADEPTTALDVTIQAQLLDVLQNSKDIAGASTLLITHDLAVVANVADRVAVMYAGRIVESGSISEIFEASQHPYTLGLLKCVPNIETRVRRLPQIAGQPPNLIGGRDPGCSFRPRCDLSGGRVRCAAEIPPLRPLIGGADHTAACHFSSELAAVGVPDRSRETPAALGEGVSRDERSTFEGGNALEVRDVRVHFKTGGNLWSRATGSVKAVDGVSLHVRSHRTLGIVGESGSGKSTLARTVVGLIRPAAGAVYLSGSRVDLLRRSEERAWRRNAQFVFQDPESSLDPRQQVKDIIAEPLLAQKGGRRNHDRTVEKLLESVGLPKSAMNRYPYQFSGGQRQRISIARALALNPSLVILDEPVSSLDVSIQAQVLNLLKDLQEELGLTYVLIAHDLSVVRHLADDVAIMYLGKVVETGSCDAVFAHPSHPYTQALLSAIPSPHLGSMASVARIVLNGDIPSPAEPPSGCRFRTRCWKAASVCAESEPLLMRRIGVTESACHFASDISVSGISEAGTASAVSQGAMQTPPATAPGHGGPSC